MGQSKHNPAKGRGSIGRPKAATVKDHWITFRVTAEEHFQLADKAQRSGMVAGEYARSRAMRGIVRIKRTPQVVAVFGDDTREIYQELRRQGVLLNQIAHHCNTHKIPPPPEVTALASTILALWQKLLTP
jgi:carbamoylphosphate synthase small subunit